MKWLSVLLAAGLLVGCSSETNEPIKEETKETSTEPSQDELNMNLKEEATQADFVELNGEELTGKKVFADGEVTNIAKEGMLGEFTLTTSDGMYTVINMMGTEVSEGDSVKIYGVTDGKDSTGFPKINATIIE
jgi:colicin import membrane protein